MAVSISPHGKPREGAAAWVKASASGLRVEPRSNPAGGGGPLALPRPAAGVVAGMMLMRMTHRDERVTAASIRSGSALAFWALVVWMGLGGPAPAGTLILKNKAVNPSTNEVQKIEIKSYLPSRVTPRDVVDLGEYELGYDVQQSLYYVRREIELAPREVRTLQVEITDIWVIPDEQFAALKAHAQRLADELRRTGNGDVAEQLNQQIQTSLAQVQDLQARTSMSVVRPLDHIRAYDANVKLLDRVKEDVSRLENLLIGAGGDPGEMLGGKVLPVQPEAYRAESGTGDVVIIRIQVRNTSQTEAQPVPVSRDLPAEVALDDVLDPGGLAVAYAYDRKVAYAYSEGVELGPGESRTFEVRLRNKWQISREKIQSMDGRLSNMVAAVRASGKFPAVEGEAGAIRDALGAFSATNRSGAVNEAYIAAFRDEVARLGDLDAKISRLEDLVKTSPKPSFMDEAGKMFRVAAPEKRTTWIIIYSILGFLALVSLLFFLRWYGKSKGEGDVPS